MGIIVAAPPLSQRGPQFQAQGASAQGAASSVAAPIEIIAANLPVVAGRAPVPVQVRVEHPILGEDRFEALKAAAASGTGPQLPAMPAPIRPSALTPGAVA